MKQFFWVMGSSLPSFTSSYDRSPFVEQPLLAIFHTKHKMRHYTVSKRTRQHLVIVIASIPHVALLVHFSTNERKINNYNTLKLPSSSRSLIKSTGTMFLCKRQEWLELKSECDTKFKYKCSLNFHLIPYTTPKHHLRKHFHSGYAYVHK